MCKIKFYVKIEMQLVKYFKIIRNYKRAESLIARYLQSRDQFDEIVTQTR